MKLKITAVTVFLSSLVLCTLVISWGGILGDFVEKEETHSIEENEASHQMVVSEVETTEDLPVIVIDPGHGGFDGGASSKDGTQEKDINLRIALKLRDIMADYPVKVVMTREEDVALLDGEAGGKTKKQQDLGNRKEIIEEANPVLAISIHLNSFPQDELVYGAQCFYPRDEIKRTSQQKTSQEAKDFAVSIQEALENGISDGREREAMAKDDILLFQNPSCPVVLAECGFLSNPDECEKLKTAEYQEKIAISIWNGINENLCLKKTKKLQIVVSANKG